MKNKYVPFLKFKSAEIGALSVLADSIKERITPFFDLPKEKNEDPAKLEEKIYRASRAAKKHLKKLPQFYLDNLDISNDILVNGRHNYYCVIDAFKDTPFIPVIGIDRKREHNLAVFEGKRNSLIKSTCVAIRIQAADFENFALVADEIEELFEQGKELFTEWDLVLDNRLCLKLDADKRGAQIAAFIKGALDVYYLRRVIVTGSSIPASIGEIIKTNSTLEHRRIELDIFSRVARDVTDPSLYLGDYTVISPYYSDSVIPGESMRNVTAPKITYTYAGVHHITRGSPLGKHELGNRQYDQMAALLITRAFFRHATYSFGEEYLTEKSRSIGKMVTPTTIIKPTVSTHITYMSRDFPA